MNLAYKKILGKFTKVLGFGKTPPHVGKISQIISFFLFESVPYLVFCLTPASLRARNIAEPPELSPRAKGAPRYSAIAVSASLT